MALIAQTKVLGLGTSTAVTVTTLSASDTLVYVPGSKQILTLKNGTAGSLTATLDGSASTTINVPGYGATLDVSAGKAIVVAAGATVAVELDAISAFLQGTVTVTGADLVTATLTV